jgi:hypothetical protein
LIDKTGDVEMKNLSRADPDNAGADGSAGRDVEMKDLNANEIQSAESKSGEDALTANQEPEVESFLHGVTDQLKWQDLISKWLAFERDHPIKGVKIFFILISSYANVIAYRSYLLWAAQRKSHGG